MVKSSYWLSWTQRLYDFTSGKCLLLTGKKTWVFFLFFPRIFFHSLLKTEHKYSIRKTLFITFTSLKGTRLWQTIWKTLTMYTGQRGTQNLKYFRRP